MFKLVNYRFFPNYQAYLKLVGFVLVTGICTLVLTQPVLAHHALGGKLPSNFFEGFLSGLAHPIIGFDHFAFIVAVGAIAATKRQGVLIPILFVLTAMVGSILHLTGVNLPATELLVASSVLIFGILLGIKDSPKILVISALAALAGIFHGYAYAEAIFGAGTTPVAAYLTGFTTIQLLVAFVAFWLGKASIKETTEGSSLSLRFAGWAIAGVGLSFLSTQIWAIILPSPIG
ncbi:HupE/UreJ family protein [Merismopedia glauca]|uniref:Urease accessory protein UreJ n=2 Tax=Merismopedia TaxID=53402 RepID=A0A2T1BX75_9CYAN|nr:urease accessory protein UreJ [Merismopedia glauca CCAP 1448/3]